MINDLGPTDLQVAHMRQNLLTRVGRQRRRRLGLIGGAALVVALGTSAAAVAVTQASVDNRNVTVDCYTSTDLGSTHATSTLVDNNRDTTHLNPVAIRVTNAVAQCEAGWTAVPTDPNVASTMVDVPNPTACQLNDGRLAVFPNRDDLSVTTFCGNLGLAAPTN